MSATLYGLGVGPGDPELITLKARRILGAVTVVAYMAPGGGSSQSRTIAGGYLAEGRTEIAVEAPMRTDRAPARRAYDRAAAEIAGHLDAGRDVAFLCEGDPFLYGSFMYVHERLAGEGYTVRVVPGVSSLTAAAASAGLPLVSRNQVLTVLPAPLPEAELEARLAAADTAVIFKVGRHLAKVRRVLDRLGMAARAVYVEHASTADERVLSLAEVEKAPYFSIVLVPGAEDAEAEDDG